MQGSANLSVELVTGHGAKAADQPLIVGLGSRFGGLGRANHLGNEILGPGKL